LGEGEEGSEKEKREIMSNTQLYLAIGLPCFTIVTSLVIGLIGMFAYPQALYLIRESGAVKSLRLQIATSNVGRGGRRYRPYVFTEQGVAMLYSVLFVATFRRFDGSSRF